MTAKMREKNGLRYIQGVPFYEAVINEREHLTPAFFPGNRFFYWFFIKHGSIDEREFMNPFIFSDLREEVKDRAQKAVEKNIKPWIERLESLRTPFDREMFLKVKEDEIAIKWADEKAQKLFPLLLHLSETANHTAIPINDKRVHYQLIEFVRDSYKKYYPFGNRKNWMHLYGTKVNDTALSEKGDNESIEREIVNRWANLFGSIKEMFDNREVAEKINRPEVNALLFNICLLSQKTPDEAYAHFPLLKRHLSGERVKFISYVTDLFINIKFMVAKTLVNSENISHLINAKNKKPAGEEEKIEFKDAVLLQPEDLRTLNEVLKRVQHYRHLDAVNVFLSSFADELFNEGMTGMAEALPSGDRAYEVDFLARMIDKRVSLLSPVRGVWGFETGEKNVFTMDNVHNLFIFLQKQTEHSPLNLFNLLLFIEGHKRYFDKRLVERYEAACMEHADIFHHLYVKFEKEEECDIRCHSQIFLQICMSFEPVADFIRTNRKTGLSPVSEAIFKMLSEHFKLNLTPVEMKEHLYKNNKKHFKKIQEVNKFMVMLALLKWTENHVTAQYVFRELRHAGHKTGPSLSKMFSQNSAYSIRKHNVVLMKILKTFGMVKNNEDIPSLNIERVFGDLSMQKGGKKHDRTD